MGGFIQFIFEGMAAEVPIGVRVIASRYRSSCECRWGMLAGSVSEIGNALPVLLWNELGPREWSIALTC